MNNLAILQALVFEPRKAFLELQARPRFWLPLLLLIVCSAGMIMWYQGKVDAEWLTDLQLRNSGFASQMSEEVIQERVKAAGQRTGLRVGISGLVGAIGVVFGAVISTLYYLLAGKITGVQGGFKQWFTLACWSSLPTLITVIPAAIALLTATSAQIDPGAMQPLSLNELFFHRGMKEPGYSLLSALQLPMLLSLYLAAFGVKVWSNRSWLFSIVLSALPLVLIFGIWAMISLRGS
jgi:hypothetical protein